MKITIATGIFIPELGGPATYASYIAEEFIKLGHQVNIVTYSDKEKYDFDAALNYQVTRIKRGNKLSNYARYFQALLNTAKGSDLVYGFDYFSAGIPAALFCKLQKKPFYIRVGGDFIWERYLEDSRQALTLREFYEKGFYKEEKIKLKISQWVLAQARQIIFTTSFQKNIFGKFYNLNKEKLQVVANPLAQMSEHIIRQEPNQEIIFAGRFNFLHNIFNLIKAFALIKDPGYRLHLIGEGPLKSKIINFVKKEKLTDRVVVEDRLSRQELAIRTTKAFLVVLPAFTDISPNLILECISGNVPFICTQEVGFDFIKDKVIIFDPKDTEQMADKMRGLLNQENYNSYQQAINSLNYSYSYNQAAQDTLKIFNL